MIKPVLSIYYFSNFVNYIPDNDRDQTGNGTCPNTLDRKLPTMYARRASELMNGWYLSFDRVDIKNSGASPDPPQ